ncbi:HK97 gp10 family phage protein [Cytobacillus sp.]|uniref:HK97 gp10 family phage protein n=1 Tax=Cytobacillus sp. TaxID=2675269 RepID=UPI0028BEFB7B|nr:HK97 gp10 family phage protein [Cytobacillus sp.]
MARWGRVDFEQLKRLQKQMQKLERAKFDKFCEECAKEIAARLLAKVIKRTVVADPSKWKTPVKGYVGGTLRRGWTAKTHAEAESGSGKGASAVSFAQGLQVTKRGNVYEILVINPVEYASYIEYGHRTRNHKGWVKGHFMMTISANEVERQAPKIIEKKLTKFLGEVFDAD